MTLKSRNETSSFQTRNKGMLWSLKAVYFRRWCNLKKFLVPGYLWSIPRTLICTSSQPHSHPWTSKHRHKSIQIQNSIHVSNYIEAYQKGQCKHKPNKANPATGHKVTLGWQVTWWPPAQARCSWTARTARGTCPSRDPRVLAWARPPWSGELSPPSPAVDSNQTFEFSLYFDFQVLTTA